MGPPRAWHPMSRKLGSLSKYPSSLPHSLSLDKACSPVLARICFKGPAYPIRLCIFLALLLLLLVARAQHIISTSKTQTADQVLVWFSSCSPHLLPSSPPSLLPGLWAPVFNCQAFKSALPMPTRHPPWPTIINRTTLARDAGHAIPCHPQWPDGPVAPVSQSVSELLRVKSQASRCHTILLGGTSKNTTPLELPSQHQVTSRPDDTGQQHEGQAVVDSLRT